MKSTFNSYLIGIVLSIIVMAAFNFRTFKAMIWDSRIIDEYVKCEKEGHMDCGQRHPEAITIMNENAKRLEREATSNK